MDSTTEVTKADPPSDEKPATEASEVEAPMRTLVAIGDLHGDYYRLVRLMRESDLLLPGTYAWNPQQNQVDLILIGDYVDWRNEPLEGPDDEWPRGSRKILEIALSPFIASWSSCV
jgi:hypothetical protein